MTTSTPPPARKGPTRLGGRPTLPASPAPGPDHGGQHHHEQTAGARVEGLPADVAEAFASAGAQAVAVPVDVASPLASKQAGQQASKGQPKRTANGTGPMTVSLQSLMAPPTDPEKDLHNAGWRLPRYFTEAVRVIAFLLRVDQQKVAAELMYAAMMGLPPGGVLADLPPGYLKGVLQEAYAEASGRTS